VAFSSDGRVMVTNTADDTAELWDVTDIHQPQTLATLTVPPNTGYRMGSIAMNPSNRVLASGAAALLAPDQNVRLWETSMERLTTHICDLVWPTITPTEWNQYLPDIPYQPPCR
jgi:WD40 repeat protein